MSYCIEKNKTNIVSNEKKTYRSRVVLRVEESPYYLEEQLNIQRFIRLQKWRWGEVQGRPKERMVRASSSIFHRNDVQRRCRWGSIYQWLRESGQPVEEKATTIDKQRRIQDCLKGIGGIVNYCWCDPFLYWKQACYFGHKYRVSQKKHSYKIFGLEIMLFTCSQTLWSCRLWWTPAL